MSESTQYIARKHQRKRRIHKIKLAVSSIILMLIGSILIATNFMLNKNEYNGYKEKANVNYKVNLKENDFYSENYLDEKSTVIASLIKDIYVDFKYNMNLDQTQNYEYSYKIVAKTTVKENSRSNSIYETTDELVSEYNQQAENKKLEIAESVNVNYNEYNEKINKFIDLYRLDNITSTLDLEMYVYVINPYDGTQINKTSKVVTLSIPLTTKTVDISIDSNLVQDTGKILTKESEYKNLEYVLGIGITFAVIGLIIFILFIKYVIDTRSAETMYEQELKQILFNYKAYIQKSNTPIDEKGYKIIQINTFDEILGLRDTMQAPILMYTEENELRTKFTIISDKILYVYVLGAQEIRNELRAKSAEKKERKETKKK